ncbi:hypothetical protein [Lysobacter panacisoli]|uniref:Uncharacterized protein n=1 Tax=Lysobacter panacisoli TaxID=1255263 RepID=A0ABP9LAH3_9GAMM|nr:hypothetical protein [Lysobacter panacisoli]
MRIFAALGDDAHQGWVWLQDPTLPPRCVVKITNLATRKSVHCEALQMDVSFLQGYNQSPRITINDPASSLVIGAWYRAGLGGLSTQTDVRLKIVAKNSWFGQFRACVGHPQVVVRLAAWLGGVGFALGVIGLVLGVASLG